MRLFLVKYVIIIWLLDLDFRFLDWLNNSKDHHLHFCSSGTTDNTSSDDEEENEALAKTDDTMATVVEVGSQLVQEAMENAMTIASKFEAEELGNVSLWVQLLMNLGWEKPMYC